MFIIQRIVAYIDNNHHTHTIYARNQVEALAEKKKAIDKGFHPEVFVRMVEWPEPTIIQRPMR